MRDIEMVVREFQQNCMHTGRFETADRYLDESLQIHPVGNVPPGREYAIEWFQSFLASFTTESFDVENMASNPPYVYQILRFGFRHTGTYKGIAPTMELIEIPGSAAFRVINGKIIDHWGLYEMSLIDRHLGISQHS